MSAMLTAILVWNTHDPRGWFAYESNLLHVFVTQFLTVSCSIFRGCRECFVREKHRWGLLGLTTLRVHIHVHARYVHMYLLLPTHTSEVREVGVLPDDCCAFANRSCSQRKETPVETQVIRLRDLTVSRSVATTCNRIDFYPSK
jgi:hypothetical protein